MLTAEGRAYRKSLIERLNAFSVAVTGKNVSRVTELSELVAYSMKFSDDETLFSVQDTVEYLMARTEENLSYPCNVEYLTALLKRELEKVF